VTAERKKYSNLARKLEITKGMLDTAENKEIILNIPMIKDKDEEQKSAFAVLSYSGKIRGL
jgi:hypothetical protein